MIQKKNRTSNGVIMCVILMVAILIWHIVLVCRQADLQSELDGLQYTHTQQYGDMFHLYNTLNDRLNLLADNLGLEYQEEGIRTAAYVPIHTANQGPVIRHVGKLLDTGSMGITSDSYNY